MASNNKQNNPSSLCIKIAAALVVIAIGLLSMEVLARIAFESKESLSRLVQMKLKLEPYKEQATNVDGHWRLRPNYRASINEIIADKQKADKWLGAKAIKQAEQSNGKSGGLIINAHGFRGPEIDVHHSCPRILTIGDSVTFGLGSITYPDFMRQHFDDMQISVEIVNAGVEGYTPRNALVEIERYKGLKPEIVIIYLGWNAIYSLDRGSYSAQPMSKIPWLLSRVQYVLKRFFEGSNGVATAAFNRAIVPDTSDPDIQFWLDVKPEFMGDLNELIGILKSDGAEIYLVTLFGLFHEDMKPTSNALDIGHLPLETDNPYVLAAMTTSFNTQLRSLARSNDVQLIDLFDWGRKNLLPLEKYFFDSVHFNAKGLERVGTFIANKISTSEVVLKQHCTK